MTVLSDEARANLTAAQILHDRGRSAEQYLGNIDPGVVSAMRDLERDHGGIEAGE